VYLPIHFRYLFCGSDWSGHCSGTAGARTTEHGAGHVVLFCFWLWFLVWCMDACLKALLHQQRPVNVACEGDWGRTEGWLLVQHPALLSGKWGMLRDIWIRTRGTLAGNRNQDSRIWNRYTATVLTGVPLCCAQFIAPAVLLPSFFSKKQTRVVSVFNSSPAAESLRCRMLPIKTLEQRNPRLSIFCPPSSPSHSPSPTRGWMRWKAKQGDTTAHCNTARSLSVSEYFLGH
jgi:hypothetical protein